jgi:ABC-2 type transport system permease protein
MSRRPDWVPVAFWESRRTLLRADFVFSVLFLPILMIGVGFLMMWFRSRSEKQVQRIAVVAFDANGAVGAQPLPARKGFRWIVPPPAAAARESLLAAIRDKRYAGAVLLPHGFAERGGVEVLVRRSAPEWKKKLGPELQAAARRARAAALGLDSVALARLDTTLATTEVVAIPAGRVSKIDRIAAFLIVTLLIVTLFVSTSYMAIGITGEKQSRVTEVIVSAIPAQAWIDGKIVAFTVIGLAQALLWVGVPALMPLFFPMWTPPAAVNPAMLAIAGVLFVLGMVLYVSLFALILSTIKDLQSTSKIQAYLYFLPVFPFWFLQPAIENPDALWVIIISQIPFFSPFLIPGRMTVGGVAPWEIALAIVLLVIGGWLLRRAAGVAFRVAMLMYGKEISLPELVRWARQA